MDTLEKILEEWEKDANINQLEPGKEIINIPKIQGKYLKALVNANLKLKKAKDTLAEIKKKKWGYYQGHYNTDKDALSDMGLPPFKLILKQDIGIYLDTDPELVKQTDKIAYLEQMIKALELILKEINNRVWELKSYMDFEKFIQGA